MIRSAGLLLLALALGASAVTPAADAARTSTRFRTVVALDPQGGVMIIDEDGSWRVEQGRTVVTRRTIGLTFPTSG